MVKEIALHKNNCLELLVATYAIQAFAKDKRDLVVHMCMDNTTAVAYVIGFGKTLRMGSARDSRNARFSSSGRNLSKFRFYHIHVEQPF